MLNEEARCQNPACGQPIEIVPGHRRRQYYDDACKQAAHRARLEAARLAAEEAARQARIEQERQALLKRWGNLLPETVDLLLYTHSLAERIVKVIRAEQEWARQTQTQERNQLIESLLLAGEQLGFQALVNDNFRLEQGVENWLAFCEQANLTTLYQAHDITHIKIHAQAARKRLIQLHPQP